MIKRSNQLKIFFLAAAFLVLLSGFAFADVPSVKVGVNMTGNGSFDQPLSSSQPNPDTGVLDSGKSWSFYLNNGADGSAAIENGVLKVTLTKVDSPFYGIQIIQSPVTLEKLCKYKISFDAKSSAPRFVIVKVGGIAGRNWAAYTGEKKINISTNMERYEFEFTMKQSTDTVARLEFWLASSIEPVWIDNISMVKTLQGIVKPEPVPGTKTRNDEKVLENWVLAWNDDFEGKVIDTSKWTFEIGNNNGWGNNESQYYMDDPRNAYVVDGKLVIQAQKKYTAEQGKIYKYTSAKMVTKGLYATPNYYRVDVMARLPEGKGIWPAIWMLGTNIDSVPWPDCGEIDIMELLGHEPWKVYGTVHGCVSAGPGIGSSFVLQGATNGNKFSNGFHKFSAEIQPNAVEFFVDDVLYGIVNRSKAQYDWGDEEWVYNRPYYLILNLAVGGNWPGYPNETTVFPQQMEVDYVRVYTNTGSFLAEGEADWDTGYKQPPGVIKNYPKTGQIIDNAFTDPDVNWVYGAFESGAAKVGFNNGIAKADISNVGGADWNVQVKTMNYINLEDGKKYAITFKAKANVGRKIKIVVEQNGGSWSRYAEQDVMLTPEMKEYKLEFTMTKGADPKAELVFMLGAVGNSGTIGKHSVELSDIVLQ